MSNQASTTRAIDDWLQLQQSAWTKDSERAKQSNFDRLPEGRYVAILTGAEVGFSKNDRPQVVWTYTVVEGDFTGETVRAYDGLNTEDGLMYLGRRLMSLGVDPASVDLAKLQVTLDRLVEAKLKVQIRLKESRDKEFLNVYLDKVLSEGVSSLPTTSAKSTTEDVPPVNMSKQKKEKKPVEKEPEPVEEVVEEVEEVLEEEPAEETVTVAIGMKVTFDWKGETLKGVINELLDDKAKVRVGNKLYPVAYDAMTVDESDLDE